MKILSLLFASGFLFATTSVAQIRYALENPLNFTYIILNFAMAFSIFMIVLNFKRKPSNLIDKLLNALGSKRISSNKAYKIG